MVVDDVWHRESWESLKRAFPNSKNGSRVIITTHKEDVAERADNKSFVHRLRFLSQEESWDLFCRKLLAVRAMVSAMKRLAKDMVDEGFIPRGEERMEDVIESVWNELIRRSLVQVANIVWEKVVECRIHDLLRYLAIKKALKNSKLMEDPMPILGKLPNLRNLELVAAYRGKQITCNDNSFGQLKFLHLDDLHNLERWDLVISAMPLIKGLGIHDCPKLNKIPKRVKKVERLKRTHL
ncbi:hypothetical protein T459_14114 [Capsicum annuum]|uniref:Uncharacterized protein n=1 Tax=Capsicum annuum TaxID=4072 RepID=A0A2G2ZGG6_CAPAN|nr:hypothetical protein T459_14114 [Capsicum annuum]